MIINVLTGRNAIRSRLDSRKNFVLIKVMPLCILFILSFHLSAQTDHLLAGASAASITPNQSCYLAGYGGAGLSKGIHDSLFVKAAVFSKGKDAVAVITLDCIGLLYPEVQSIRQRLSEIMPAGSLPPENIILSSTHTHLGPDVVGLWGPHIFRSGVQKEYMRFLLETVAQTIKKAWQKREPVRIEWATGTFGEGWVQNISLPAELDRSVTTLYFRSDRNTNVATLTNFACHPTLVGHERKMISADYVSGFYRELDEQLGGVNLFLQGSIGGWVQPVGEDSFENAERQGRGLAMEVLRMMTDSKKAEQDSIEFRRKVFRMPVRSFGFKLLSFLGVLDRKIGRKVTTEVALLRLGPATLITHPGETSPAYGLETKRLIGGTGPVMVLGLAQDALGYLLKPEFFDKKRAIPHSDYLTKVSVGKDGGPVMMREISAMVNSN